eukprot:323346-Pleurochrysis_carterae.AAC.1
MHRCWIIRYVSCYLSSFRITTPTHAHATKHARTPTRGAPSASRRIACARPSAGLACSFASVRTRVHNEIHAGREVEQSEQLATPQTILRLAF